MTWTWNSWRKPTWFASLVLIFLGPSVASAQQTDDVPVISGGAGLFAARQGGVNVFQPVIAPVITVPLGDRWLIESRTDIREVLSRQNGTTGDYQGQFFGTIEYLQLDYNLSSHMTITAGRFLTPFGIFNERVTPIWINKFQDAPFIAPIGTAAGYSNGFMLRGAALSNGKFAINYTAYFSTLSTITHFESERGAGGRVGLFLPGTRLEVGMSYERRLQDPRMNSFGNDISWSPYSAPLEVKGEWAHAPGGHGYWIQAAYRLSQLGGATSPIGRLEPVFRMQQFFRSQQITGDSLPGRNMSRPDIGLNYYLPHEVRLNASYGRQFVSHSTDVNVWQFGITYRFLFPLWRGE